MSLILGVDPGSRKTGFGIINTVAGRHEYVTSGVIRAQDGVLFERLKIIYSGLCVVVEEYSPQEAAIEQVFMAKSAGSALKLGQARGASIVAIANNGLPIAEYETRKIKQSIVGNGGAEKGQVQHMVKQILGLSSSPQEDAADALAVALCHSNSRRYMTTVIGAKYFRKGRIR